MDDARQALTVTLEDDDGNTLESSRIGLFSRVGHGLAK
jgi:hypothetical protein